MAGNISIGLVITAFPHNPVRGSTITIMDGSIWLKIPITASGLTWMDMVGYGPSRNFSLSFTVFLEVVGSIWQKIGIMTTLLGWL